MTYTRGGKFSTGYLRVNRVGDTSPPKPNRDPQGLSANVGRQADQMKLFADQVQARLSMRLGASPATDTRGSQRRAVKDPAVK